MGRNLCAIFEIAQRENSVVLLLPSRKEASHAVRDLI